jgi:hypothetical protein
MDQVVKENIEKEKHQHKLIIFGHLTNCQNNIIIIMHE